MLAFGNLESEIYHLQSLKIPPGTPTQITDVADPEDRNKREQNRNKTRTKHSGFNLGKHFEFVDFSREKEKE